MKKCHFDPAFTKIGEGDPQFPCQEFIPYVVSPYFSRRSRDSSVITVNSDHCKFPIFVIVGRFCKNIPRDVFQKFNTEMATTRRP